MDWDRDISATQFDAADPNPWQALYFDQSLPMDLNAKRALLQGQNSLSRRLFLPLIRPLARLTIILVQLLRMVIPGRVKSSKLLHQTIYLGLKYFARQEANYLILRHFNIGTELLQFIADNVQVEIGSTVPLRPRRLEDLKNDTFLIHDLNVYNFILELNQKLNAENRHVGPVEAVNFDAITDAEFELELPAANFFNAIDLQTAIEAYTPIYGLLLSDQDFWRASNSLQLDETIAIYISKILNEPMALALVNNRHPTVPIITLQAGFRLMLHGLDAEILHGYLREQKRLANSS